MTKIDVHFSGREKPIYKPGEKVEGEVTVDNAEKIKSKGIIIRFRGKSHNRWYDYGRRMYFEKKEFYADNTVTVWPEAGKSDQSLDVGHHRFSFSFLLPENAPCTFEGVVGWVRYGIYVTIDVPFRKDIKTLACFHVLPKADLNQDERAKIPPKKEVETEVGLLSPKPVKILALCNKGGYVPGETIDITLDIDNKSNDNLSMAKVWLEQKSKFTGTFNHKFVKKSNIAKLKEKPTIASHSQGRWKAKISVPSIPPSDLPGCSIIDLKFRLQFEVKIGKRISFKLPIIIGTVPLDTRSESFGLPSYQESVFGSVDVKDKDEEEEHFTGNTVFTPLYTFYDLRQSLLQEGNH
ncbi:unnamed protein product [Clavelina lepadiformis]|uniref:Arrestin C-terminal-like domain-containing protein n=1 Tax=Clavelina lepadiformis TaxID=159417 RepID=A0ABP0FT67_CLALP